MTAAETRLDRQYTRRIVAITAALFGVGLLAGGRKTMDQLPDDGALVAAAGVVMAAVAVAVFVFEWSHALYESTDGLRQRRLTFTGWRESAVRYADVDDVRIHLSRKSSDGRLGLVNLGVEGPLRALNLDESLDDQDFSVEARVASHAGTVTFGRHIVEPMALLRRVQAATWQQRFARRASQLQSHGSVEFGPIALHADHLVAHGTKLPQASISLLVEQRRLLLVTPGSFSSFRAKEVLMADVPNLDVLLALCGIDVLAPPNATTKAEPTSTSTTTTTT
jgi:hypothetical protein